MSATMVNAFDPADLGRAGAVERALMARRERVLGPAYRLFYRNPVHVVRAEGVWLQGPDGERYLDAYNNVACVGHGHPRVVEAIARQAATLNTHTRYLNEVVLEYAERLAALLPPDLQRIMFTCTGSEANDLALRIARTATGGRGVIVTANAYHGVTELLAGMSPSLGTGAPLRTFVRAVPPPRPDEADAGEAFAGRVAEAAHDLARAGHGPATLLVDTVLSSDGVLGTIPALAPAAAAIRAAGGLVVADEVQAGLGRVGERFWGFAAQGLEPDLVTCGKPMGNGHPVAMVALRADLSDLFGARVRYFNTFGGNPVSAAAGLAVLDVLRDEGLPAHAGHVGKRLVAAIGSINDARIVAVRGSGLSIGVELDKPSTATEVVNGMRDRCVLVSATGPDGRVVKIRPPLPFADEHADLLVDTMRDTLAAAS